jgi:hypothetical protein
MISLRVVNYVLKEVIMPYLQDLKLHFSRYSWPVFAAIVGGLLIYKAQKTLSQSAVGHNVSALSCFLSLAALPR